MRILKNKYAVITGGANGIGLATVRALAKEGANGIIVADMNLEKAQEACTEIEAQTGCKCIAVGINVSVYSDIKKLFETAVNNFGTLDILVNCAGICSTDKIEEIDEEAWDRMMDINLKGTYLCCKEALKIMQPNKYGKIVNISSVSGRVGGFQTGINYATSKGAIITLTMSLAKLAGPLNINVNSVAPGFINTEMTKNFTYFNPETVPLRRMGTPEDVADVITFLASDKSSYITGCTLDVNGGQYMI